MSEGQVKIFTVAELTRGVRQLLENAFGSFWIRGEISEFSAQTASGHVYMSLKDATSQIRAVFFRGARACQDMALAVGSEVEIYGHLTVYEPRGEYQILVEGIRPVGQGSLRQQFEEMRRRLEAEGLFAMERKRPIPSFPKIIGVVTSKDGAAVTDFLNVLARRHSAGLHVRIFPTIVQGKDAAPRIANALRYINEHRLCDVIVVTRGGGSLEDLWPFNEEVLARAVYASEIPVISAVGHERDFSICDFVADKRCATPSVAAEEVIAAKASLLDRVHSASVRMSHVMRFRLSEARRHLDQLSGNVFLLHPEEMLMRRRQYLDSLVQRLAGTLPQRASVSRQRLVYACSRLASALPVQVERARMRGTSVQERFGRLGQQLTALPRQRLEHAVASLNLLGPKNVLGRGYAILLNSKGHAVRAPEEVTGGERLKALLAGGEIETIVYDRDE